MNYKDNLGAFDWGMAVGAGQQIASDAMETYRYIKMLESQLATSKNQLEVAKLTAQLSNAKIQFAREQLAASKKDDGSTARNVALIGGLAALGLTVVAAQ